MTDIRNLVDRLNQSRAARERDQPPAGTGAPPRPPIDGLRYQPGDAVIELGSGYPGTVRAAARESVSGAELYEITLRDGRTVYRSVTEIGRDTPPRSPAIR